MTDTLFEIWKPAPAGFERYEVSDQGRVRNRESGYVLQPWEDANERGIIYLRVDLYRGDGTVKKWYVHRLVMYTFKPRPDAHLLEVNHKKRDTLDNRLVVLEWMTKAEHYAWTHGLTAVPEPEEAPF